MEKSIFEMRPDEVPNSKHREYYRNSDYRFARNLQREGESYNILYGRGNLEAKENRHEALKGFNDEILKVLSDTFGIRKKEILDTINGCVTVKENCKFLGKEGFLISIHLPEVGKFKGYDIEFLESYMEYPKIFMGYYNIRDVGCLYDELLSYNELLELFKAITDYVKESIRIGYKINIKTKNELDLVNCLKAVTGLLQKEYRTATSVKGPDDSYGLITLDCRNGSIKFCKSYGSGGRNNLLMKVRDLYKDITVKDKIESYQVGEADNYLNNVDILSNHATFTMEPELDLNSNEEQLITITVKECEIIKRKFTIGAIVKTDNEGNKEIKLEDKTEAE